MLISQPAGRSATRFTVRLTPFTVIEPLYAKYFASSRGARMRSSQLSPVGAK